MIADAFILPTEKPFALYDIKRALLSFDKVILPSPNDRELIPFHTFLPCVAFTNPKFLADVQAMSVHPNVRPLGKTNRYDQSVEMTLAECKTAIGQGSLAVRDAPPIPSNYFPKVQPGGSFLGIISSLANKNNDVELPAGSPDPFYVYRSYRAMAGDPAIVAAVTNSLDLTSFEIGQIDDELAPTSADDPGGFGAIIAMAGPSMRMQTLDPFPYPPLLPVAEVRTLNQKGSLKGRIVLSRIATLAKYLATCQKNGWQTYSSDPSLSQAIKVLQPRVITALERIPQNDVDQEMAARLMRFHQILLREILDPQSINKLSVDEILRLRSSAWGRAGNARAKLFEALANLARDGGSPSELDKAIEEEIGSYQHAVSDFKNEAKRLGLEFMTVCGAGLTAAGTGTLEHIAAGSITLFLGLALSGVPVCAELKQVLALWKRREKIACMPGCALLEPYSFVAKKKTD